jgi:hypothetical protein
MGPHNSPLFSYSNNRKELWVSILGEGGRREKEGRAGERERGEGEGRKGEWDTQLATFFVFK